MQASGATLCCDQLLTRAHRSAQFQQRYTALQQLWQSQQRLLGTCLRISPRQIRLNWQSQADLQQRQLIAEAEEDLAEAKELQDSYYEALEAAIKLLYGATLVAGFAFELFGAWQCRQHAAAEYACSADESAPQAHTTHIQSATINPAPPNVALRHHAVGRAGIWSLLLLALGQSLLSWVRERRQFLAPHVSRDGQLSATTLSLELQGCALGEVRQQVSGLQLRTRTSSRDINTKLRQFQQESEQQAGAIAAIAADATQQTQRLEDTEALLGALQVVSSKQFALLTKALPDISSRAGATSALTAAKKLPSSTGDTVPSGNDSTDGALPAVSAFHGSK